MEVGMDEEQQASIALPDKAVIATHKRPWERVNIHVFRKRRRHRQLCSMPIHSQSQSELLTRLLGLPPELKLSILSYLDFGEVERLRRTCKLLRTNISKGDIRSLFPDLILNILSTCSVCLTTHAIIKAPLVRNGNNGGRNRRSSSSSSSTNSSSSSSSSTNSNVPSTPTTTTNTNTTNNGDTGSIHEAGGVGDDNTEDSADDDDDDNHDDSSNDGDDLSHAEHVMMINGRPVRAHNVPPPSYPGWRSPSKLVLPNGNNKGLPFASLCLHCAAGKNVFVVGRQYVTGDFASCWICRWCGVPVHPRNAMRHNNEFHKDCSVSWASVRFISLLLRLTEWVAAIVGAALCWAYYKHDVLVLAPTIVNFFMIFWAACLLFFRTSGLRTYHWSLIVEAGILGLWVPPLIQVIQSIPAAPRTAPASTGAVLFFILLNMILRLLTVLGNFVLMCEYSWWPRKRPNGPFWRRLSRRVICWLAFLTYPRMVEQDYPARWWFKRRNGSEWSLASATTSEVVEEAIGLA